MTDAKQRMINRIKKATPMIALILGDDDETDTTEKPPHEQVGTGSNAGNDPNGRATGPGQGKDSG